MSLEVILTAFLLTGYPLGILGLLNSDNEAAQSMFGGEQRKGAFRLLIASLLSSVALLILLLLVPWMQISSVVSGKVSLGAIWMLLVFGALLTINGTLYVLSPLYKYVTGMGIGVLLLFLILENSFLDNSFDLLFKVIAIFMLLWALGEPMIYHRYMQHSDS